MKTTVLLASALALVAVAPAQDVKDAVGKPLPKLSIKDLAGKTHTNASLKGKVVLLDFWATWCAPCKAAAPTMNALYGKYKGKGLQVIGVNITDQAPAVKKYVAEHKYTYPFTPASDAFAKDLGVKAIPVFVLVDKTGKVRNVIVGFNVKSSPAEIEALVKKLL
ncbi:TlpA family protein disulfide reductase [bacterium]|nr:MAG: TlpA family protein disulfide reductase [bacterium]